MIATLLLVYSALRLALAAVFLLSGVAKLADREATRTSLSMLGLPRRFTRPAVLLLPISEILIGAACIPSRTSHIASVLALLLLVEFTFIAIAASVRGLAANCSCFGRFFAKQLGTQLVIRNLILIALAIAVAAHDHIATSKPQPNLSALEVATLSVIALSAVLSFADRANLQFMHRAPSMSDAGIGPEISAIPLQSGSIAPAFELFNGDDSPVSLDDLLPHGGKLVFVFVDEFCSSCEAIVNELARRRAPLPISLKLVLVVNENGAQRFKNLIATATFEVVVLSDRSRVAAAYGVRGFPAAALIDESHRLATKVFIGRSEVERFLADIL